MVIIHVANAAWRLVGAILSAVAEAPPVPTDETDLAVAKTSTAIRVHRPVAVATRVGCLEAKARGAVAQSYDSSRRH
jgi:hypothetical protein